MITDIIQKISSETGMPEDEVNDKIEEKKLELSGMISDEGAAYIVAKELGVTIRKIQRLNIGNIITGMQNADVIGKIVKVSEKAFEKDGNKGRVMSVILGDGTGTIRLSLWNDEIDKFSGFTRGDTVHVRGFVKEGLFGPELRLGRYGTLLRSDETIQDVLERKTEYERSPISELAEGQHRQIRAPIVQVFGGNIFYEICPVCKGRAKEWKCQEHGDIQPEYGLVISGIADDGTGNIRIVAFNDAAEKLIGMSKFEAKRLFDMKKKMEAVIEKIPLGRELVIDGRVSRNALFDRMEFVVNGVSGIDMKREIETLLA
ncbi:MAG: hypothetical protein HYT73_00910 [Candidatus Aenigmarchaeota archaeon]|nr:hypothetical protein [Candidatus Aenigmarchaeota archaeon]